MFQRLTTSFLTIVAIFLSTSAFAQDTYQNDEYGFEVSPPDGWTRIPDADVQGLYSRANKPGSGFKWDAAFQAYLTEPSFTYPYAIVQVMPYEQQPSESEIVDFIGQINSADWDEESQKTLTDEANKLMSDIEPGEVVYDDEQRSYAVGYNLQVAGVGLVRGYTRGWFGKRAAVQISFYAVAENWRQYTAQRHAMTQSFAFAPGAEYEPSFNDKYLGGLPPIALHAIIGGIVGGLVSVLSLLFKKAGQ